MKKEICQLDTIHVLNKIYANLCRLNQNFDVLINLAGQTRKQTEFSEDDFASYSKFQTTKSTFQAIQKEKQRNYKNSTL